MPCADFSKFLCALTLGLTSLMLTRSVEAQNQGFTINRYDPHTSR